MTTACWLLGVEEVEVDVEACSTVELATAGGEKPTARSPQQPQRPPRKQQQLLLLLMLLLVQVPERKVLLGAVGVQRHRAPGPGWRAAVSKQN